MRAFCIITILFLFFLVIVTCCSEIPVEDAEKNLAIEYARLAESQITIACTEAKWWENPKATELCTSKKFWHPPANCKSHVRYRFFDYAPNWLDSTSDVIDPPYFDDKSDPAAMLLRVADFCGAISKDARLELGCWVPYRQSMTLNAEYDYLRLSVGQQPMVTHPNTDIFLETVYAPVQGGGYDMYLGGKWELRPSKNKVCARYHDLRKALKLN